MAPPMSSEIPLPPGEREQWAESARAPIRIPDAVQPHGALLVVDAHSWRITHASENTARILGVGPMALLGHPLDDLLDVVTRAAIENALDPDSNAGNPVSALLAERHFDVIVHRSGGSLTLDFEPHEATPPGMIQATRATLRRLARLQTIEQLWAWAATELRKITGFDRVMVYHFHPDRHGEVVAEAAADGLESYLGLHFPTSDVSASARELYLTKLSRQIVNSHRAGVALLADANQLPARDVDLSLTELRAVSPKHLEFLRDMGQTSTFSLSLVLNGVLVGMIACSHRTERRLPFDIRDGLELLANQVSLQIGSFQEIERLGQRAEAQNLRAALVAQLSREDDLVDALLHQHVTLLDLVPADGAAVSIGGRTDTIGTVPPRDVLARLDQALAQAGVETRLVTHSLSTEYPELSELMPTVAGLLVKRLGGVGDYLAWFRHEQPRTVRWLGDMTPSHDSNSGRRSIAAPTRTQDVGGDSESWHGLEREARELARDLQAIMLQRVQSQLAELALHDPLTGLANRRLLMDRLHQELAHLGDSEQLAVIFIDVDQFKSINDNFGHSAGDDALIHVGRALTHSARSGDTVARLGGDEFVVLCTVASANDAAKLAKRTLAALSAEPAGSPGWRVSGSAGIALAGPGSDASHVLSAADAAMYRAKVAGGGLASM